MVIKSLSHWVIESLSHWVIEGTAIFWSEPGFVGLGDYQD